MYVHRMSVCGYVCTCIVSYFAMWVFLQQDSTEKTWAKKKSQVEVDTCCLFVIGAPKPHLRLNRLAKIENEIIKF